MCNITILYLGNIIYSFILLLRLLLLLLHFFCVSEASHLVSIFWREREKEKKINSKINFRFLSMHNSIAKQWQRW